MKILGIESSSITASVAVLEDGILKGEYTINHTLKHSTTLMPMIDELLSRIGMDISDIDLIAVSEGPGSFTGLRIGSATAKGLAHGMNIPVASIPTLKAIASNGAGMADKVGVVVYARAREVYYQEFTFEPVAGFYKPVEVAPIVALEVDELQEKLLNNREELLILGDGAVKFVDIFSQLPEHIHIVNPVYDQLSAKHIGLQGLLLHMEGKTISHYQQKPYYHKKSQAEREYDEKHGEQ